MSDPMAPEHPKLSHRGKDKTPAKVEGLPERVRKLEKWRAQQARVTAELQREVAAMRTKLQIRQTQIRTLQVTPNHPLPPPIPDADAERALQRMHEWLKRKAPGIRAIKDAAQYRRSTFVNMECPQEVLDAVGQELAKSGCTFKPEKQQLAS